MSDGERTTEVVRGALDEKLAERILAFWERHSALRGDQARDRLDQVICVMWDESGEVIGVNSADGMTIPELGGRRFWVHRSLFAPTADVTAWEEMLETTFEVLADEFSEAEGATPPIGVCALVGDPAILDRRPEALWPDLRFLYAGYLPDGRQIRIRYFDEGRV